MTILAFKKINYTRGSSFDYRRDSGLWLLKSSGGQVEVLVITRRTDTIRKWGISGDADKDHCLTLENASEVIKDWEESDDKFSVYVMDDDNLWPSTWRALSDD